MSSFRNRANLVSLLTLTWHLLFMLAPVALCCEDDERHPRPSTSVAHCPVHGSRAAAMHSMAKHDAPQQCDCASMQCPSGGAVIAVFGPAAVLPSRVALQHSIDPSDLPRGLSPSTIRLAALPLSPPPRA
jgi:hypothetical protein